MLMMGAVFEYTGGSAAGKGIVIEGKSLLSKGPVIKHVLGWAGEKIETSKNLVAQPED